MKQAMNDQYGLMSRQRAAGLNAGSPLIGLKQS
jgi:hypothetical protein